MTTQATTAKNDRKAILPDLPDTIIQRMTAREWRAFYLLNLHRNKHTGQAYPSLHLLEARSGIDRNSLRQEILPSLSELGLVNDTGQTVRRGVHVWEVIGGFDPPPPVNTLPSPNKQTPKERPKTFQSGDGIVNETTFTGISFGFSGPISWGDGIRWGGGMESDQEGDGGPSPNSFLEQTKKQTNPTLPPTERLTEYPAVVVSCISPLKSQASTDVVVSPQGDVQAPQPPTMEIHNAQTISPLMATLLALLPRTLSEKELASIVRRLLPLEPEVAEDVAQVLAEKVDSGTVRNPGGYLTRLLEAVKAGTFTKSTAILEAKAAAEREKQERVAEEKRHQEEQKAEQQADADKAKKNQVDEFLASVPDDEKKAMQTAFLATFKPDHIVLTYAKAEGFQSFLVSSLFRNYIFTHHMAEKEPSPKPLSVPEKVSENPVQRFTVYPRQIVNRGTDNRVKWNRAMENNSQSNRFFLNVGQEAEKKAALEAKRLEYLKCLRILT